MVKLSSVCEDLQRGLWGDLKAAATGLSIS
jgi:hypothetical protein